MREPPSRPGGEHSSPEGGKNDPAGRFASVIGQGTDARKARDLRTYGPPKRHTNLIWLAIALGGAVLFVVLIRGVLEKTKWTAGPSGSAPPATSR